MIADGKGHDGTIKVYFIDNTYKTLPLTRDTSVNEVVEWLCSRLSSTGGRHVDPSRHELFIIAPGNQTLRERRLQREDKPLEIKAKGGSQAFKFLFRETQPQRPLGDAGFDSAGGVPETHNPCEAAASGGSSIAGPDASISSPAMKAVAEAVPVADISGALRTGALERPFGEPASATCNWYKSTIVLMEDRLWYSQAPSGSGGGMGGGMSSTALCDCEKVFECQEDKRSFKLITKSGAMTFRARHGQERSSWLLSIAKQAAFVKERGILEEAERIITSIEFKRSNRQLARLDSFETLSGVLAVKETRDLFLDFARGEWDSKLARDAGAASCPGDEPLVWPAGLTLDALIAGMEQRSTAAENERSSAQDPIYMFAENGLFPRFYEHPQVQMRICRIAAGVDSNW